MKNFDVYPIFDIEPVKASGSWLWDKEGNKYLDLYGGHAVISIGHSHPHYVSMLSEQVSRIGFYSNSVKMSLQDELASKLGELCGYPDYFLFLCNSGAEANENAFKLASFHNQKKKIISFSKGFHGRTSLAVAATDNPSIVAPVNKTENTVILPFNDINALEKNFDDQVCAVIVEGIQGVGGINVPTDEFLLKIRELCDKFNAVFIADEIQSGYGRTGKFFYHQYSGVKADIISVAKGIGNGFPLAAILISPKFKATHGMLGTTFGGNHLACAAGIAVLDVMKKENLVQNAGKVGEYIMQKVKGFDQVKEVRGKGMMIGIELNGPCADVRNTLLKEFRIFTGNSSNKNTLRLLPALSLSMSEADIFLNAFETVLSSSLVK